VEIGDVISEMAGGIMMLRGVVQLGRLAKNFFKGADVPEVAGEASVEDLAQAGAEAGVESTVEVGSEITGETVGEGVTEAAAEAVVEGASFAGLASTGIAIFAAVGVDAILGAIDGAKEKEELNKQIDKLQIAVTKCNKYLSTLKKKGALDSRIVTEEDRFTRLMQGLESVSKTPPKLKFDVEPSLGNASRFLTLMHRALSQYGDFINIRTSWARYSKRHPKARENEFIDAYMNFAGTQNTEQDIRKYFSVLADASDGMRNALDTNA
jgi:hypothetical protein